MLSRPKDTVVLDADVRQRYTLAFDTDQAERYHRLRPGYQPEILEFLTGQQPGLAVDLGAGTGHFSTRLVQAGWDVVAVDPAEHMLAELARNVPEATTVVASVETLHTDTWARRAELVVCAQAWHWIDTEIGSAKVAQLLTDTGVFGVVHHQIDTTQDWVLRLCKIMHSGDVHAIDQPPTLSRGLFTNPQGRWWRWEQHLRVEQVHQLMMTRAFYLRTSKQQRARMHENLQWYLVDYLGYGPGEIIAVPYVTAAWRMQKRQLGA